MKRLLFISISCPPKSGPESLQTGKYLKGLSKHFHIDFITTRAIDYGWNKIAGKREDLLTPFVNSIMELNGYNGRIGSKIKSWLPKQIKFPDDHFHFHKSSKYVLKHLTRLPDAIYSRSSPLSSTLLAYKLKEKINRPWILHLSDPWANNPFHTYDRKKNEYWEQVCISKADLVTVTNKNYQNFLREKYPAHQNKFKISYNVYEQVDVKPLDFSKKFTMIYFGNFYGDRHPGILLKPLSKAYHESPDSFNNLNVFFYGNIDSKSRQIIEKYKLPFVLHKGFFAQNDIPSIVENATLLVNLEDRFASEPSILFLPSKIMDYISYQKLILSISSSLSPSSPIISNNYGHVFTHDNINGIASFIKGAIKAFSEKNHNFFKVLPPDNLYSSEFQVEKLKNRILKLL